MSQDTVAHGGVLVTDFLPSVGVLGSELPPLGLLDPWVACVWQAQECRANYRLRLLKMARLPLMGCALGHLAPQSSWSLSRVT